MADNSSDASKIRKDAEGQFAPNQGDRKASGVASAKPTVITGTEDATAAKNPARRRARAIGMSIMMNGTPKTRIPIIDLKRSDLLRRGPRLIRIGQGFLVGQTVGLRLLKGWIGLTHRRRHHIRLRSLRRPWVGGRKRGVRISTSHVSFL